MLVKMGGAAALLMGGLYFGGVLDHGYTREVGRPQAEVIQALADLDITAQPGAPGTDPSRSGGVAPMFRLERQPNAMVWTVMSGNQVATRMIADIVPVDATHTRVTARVERGDAPDDFVSPAFRSTGVTMGLFSMALESELNALTTPATDAAGCDKLMENFREGGAGIAAEQLRQREAGQHNLTKAMGDGARTVMMLHAVEGERRRLGCDNRPAGDFAAPSAMIQEGDASPARPDETSFVPGEPMLDPNPADPSR